MPEAAEALTPPAMMNTPHPHAIAHANHSVPMYGSFVMK